MSDRSTLPPDAFARFQEATEAPGRVIPGLADAARNAVKLEERMSDPDISPQAVERYNPEQDVMNEYLGMWPNPDGDYVRYEDYAALSAALEAAEVAARYESDIAEKALQEMRTQRDRAEAAEAKLEEAATVVSRYVYETHHLSPLQDDGSHWCKISAECLQNARAFLASMEKPE